ncbi:Glycerol-3-phosphate transporter [Gammaproteobacteria bacterium]
MGFFTRLSNVFNPPAHIEPLPHDVVERDYKKHRRMVFSGIFFGYGASYLIRNNFSLAMPYLTEQGFTKTQLGTAFSAIAIAYGFSKFLMGNVSDRSNPRFFLAAGLIVSAIINFILGFSAWACSSIVVMFALLFINGWAQGMTYPPCVRVLAHWYSVKDRGLVMSFWNVSHNLGGGLMGAAAVAGMWIFGEWQSLFYFPAMITAVIIIFVLITVRDTPQSVGLPSIEDYHSKNYIKKHAIETAVKEVEEELTAKEIFLKHIFNNKAVWMLAIANIFVYFVRYGIQSWAPLYLHEIKSFDYKGQGLAYFLYEYAGIPSMLLAGYLSDKYFRNRRAPVIIVCMVLVIFAISVYWLNPPGHKWVDLVALSTIGFLIYVPVVFIGMQAVDVVYKKAVGTATGLTGFFGYMFGTVCANIALGAVVQHFGWDAGFITIISACVIAVLCLIPLWNVGGEDYKAPHHKKHEVLETPPQTQ